MRIEKGLKKVTGVIDANVNLATEKTTVTYDPTLTTLTQMVQKVEAVGYKATPQTETPAPLLATLQESVTDSLAVPATAFSQASAVLSKVGVYAYPMVNPPCGDLREAGAPIPEPTAMSPEELRADFQQSHRVLAQTDSWEKLNRVASSAGVISVDPFLLPKHCPAHAPVS
jgi:copper chaperone CopZ